MSEKKRLELCLFVLRISVFLVMIMWTIDKFVNTEHAVHVFEKFYMVGGLSHTIIYIIGVVQLILVLGFVAGFKKKITYGLILALHAVSTLSSYANYFDPYSGANLLFFAAWPMLAACWVLYYLRDRDNYMVYERG